MEEELILGMLIAVGHIKPIYSEDSELRKLLLKAYAWKEVELLTALFWASKLPVFKLALIRKPLYYLFFHFLGSRGVVCQAATLEETHAFIDSLPDEHEMAVGPCRCRMGNRNCHHSLLTDIVIKDTSKIWSRELFPEDYRVIDKEEAKEICSRSRQEGMFQTIDRHMYFNESENYFVICNCCKESCVPVIAYRLFKDEPYSFLPSTYVSRVNEEICEKCGWCVEKCPFEERVIKSKSEAAVVLNCQGCGLCADVCPNGAVEMVLR